MKTILIIVSKMSYADYLARYFIGQEGFENAKANKRKWVIDTDTFSLFFVSEVQEFKMRGLHPDIVFHYGRLDTPEELYSKIMKYVKEETI